jgi:hypothetical protein
VFGEYRYNVFEATPPRPFGARDAVLLGNRTTPPSSSELGGVFK